jgi:hypothetical protein
MGLRIGRVHCVTIFRFLLLSFFRYFLSLRFFLLKAYPTADVYPISALAGDGIHEWLNHVLRGNALQKPSYLIDYDIYAKAEAALGWYNGFATLQSMKNENINAYLVDLLEAIKGDCIKRQAAIAHIKAYAVTGLDYAKASVTSAEEDVSFNKKAEFEAKSFNLIVNARVEASPALLERMCQEAIKNITSQLGMTLAGYNAECFAPSYPTPKYRMA